MSKEKEFEGEVKKVGSKTGRKGEKQTRSKPATGRTRGEQPEPEAGSEESPLKTVGGTPIIERPNG